MSEKVLFDDSKETSWSRQKLLDQLANDSPADVKEFVIYWLWESTIDQMIKHGTPTNADVKKWIEVISKREDSSTPDISIAIECCKEYF